MNKETPKLNIEKEAASTEDVEALAKAFEEKDAENAAKKNVADVKAFDQERKLEMFKTIEKMAKNKAAEYADSAMAMLELSEASLSGGSLVRGMIESLSALTKEIDPNGPGINKLARKELKAALEEKMASLGGDDVEKMSKLEKLIDSLEDKKKPDAKENVA